MEIDELVEGREVEEGSSIVVVVAVAPIDLGANTGDNIRFCGFECRLCCCEIDLRIPVDVVVDVAVAFAFVRFGWVFAEGDDFGMTTAAPARIPYLQQMRRR